MPLRDADDEVVEDTTRPVLKSDKRIARGEPVEPGVEAGSPGRSEARIAVSASFNSGTTRVAPQASVETTRLGPYQIVCELASGGMATVYLALYRSIEGFEKLCAVKRIHPHLATDRAFTTMFADEAQIAARISHPFVCSVFSYGRSQQSYYLAMEFLRGEPLSAVCRRVARTPELGDDPRFPALAARLLANFAEGLHAAHSLRDDRGASFDVVHRDVTPQNLFVLYDGTVRVTDFGIAHARRRIHQTDGQRLKGKLSYVAPEQLNGGPVDRLVDIWGLGVTLWELLVGRRLFLGANEGETLAAVVSRTVPAPSSLRATVPPELDRIVLRALERDPSKRYKTARDFSRDLERFLASIGDGVPTMDVADWMAQVFPQGAERVQRLMELAARVSAATADETVVRVPSAPPPRDSSPAASFLMVAAEPSSSLPPAEVETRAAPVSVPRIPASARRPEPLKATPVSADESFAAPPGSSNTPKSAVVAALMSAHKPRLQLVEEPTSDHPRPGKGQGWWSLAAAISLGLLLTGGTSLWLRRPAQVPLEPSAMTGSPPPQVVKHAEPANELHSAAPVASTTETAPLPAETAPLPAETAPVPVETAPAAKPAPKRAVALAPTPLAPAQSAPPTAASTATMTGVVMITTPGGSGVVYEAGRLLGNAPGAFRLSVGDHTLELRSPSGATRSLTIRIKSDAPTLVTVPDARP